MSVLRSLLALAAGLALVAGCTTPPVAPSPGPRLSRMPPVASPAENPTTPAKVALGAKLFYDPRLSGPGTMACEGCHYRHQGWTYCLSLSKRPNGVMNTRHTPTLYNVGQLKLWYWDGRATTLEGQVNAAWGAQMAVPDTKAVADRIAAVAGYRDEFQQVWGAPPSPELIVKSLAAYLRSLDSGLSPWDRYEMGDRASVSADAVAGNQLFMGKARCAICHTPPLYTDGLFHNVGLEVGKEKPDAGRGAISKDAKDNGAFKTPTLRSVALSGPYFHDGSADRLEDAVRYMASGGMSSPNRSPLLENAQLTNAEIGQLVAFLRSLTSEEPAVKPRLP